MGLRLLALVWLFINSLGAQVNEHELKRLYRTTPDGAFILSADVTLKTVFDQHRKACTLILRGPIPGDQVLNLFNVLVPLKIRGVKKNEPLWCVGVCEHALIYQNVTLLTGAVGSQTSDPAAIITFSRTECKAAVAEANKTVLNIKR